MPSPVGAGKPAAGAGQGEQEWVICSMLSRPESMRGADQTLHVHLTVEVLMTPRLVEVSVTPRNGVAHASPRSGQAIRASSRQDCRLSLISWAGLSRAVSSTVRVGFGSGQLALIDAGVTVDQGLELLDVGGGHQQAGAWPRAGWRCAGCHRGSQPDAGRAARRSLSRRTSSLVALPRPRWMSNW